ncbi:MAG: hypothetical protein ACREUE_04665 [Panacagrimonas sp.]
MPMHPRLRELMDLLSDAQARFESAQSSYRESRARSQRETTREEWYDGAHYAPCPFGLERLGLTPGTPLQHVPRGDARSHTCRYGLSRDGRVQVEQQFTEFSDRAYEEFWIHEDHRILTARYDYYEPDKALINVQTIFLEPGPAGLRAAALVRWAQHGVALEAYEYDDAIPNRLRRVHTAAREHFASNPPLAWMTTIDEPVYDAKGGLKQIDRTWEGGSRERIYPEVSDPGESP